MSEGPRQPIALPQPPVSRPKPHFGSMSGLGNLRTGSPINGHARRPSNPLIRSRKQFRRSLSMVREPSRCHEVQEGDLAPPTTLQAVMDIEEPHEPVLPHFFPEGQDDSIPRITPSTMLERLMASTPRTSRRSSSSTAGSSTEYDGGHINGAINYNDKDLLAAHLFRTPMEGRTLVIFHCEYWPTEHQSWRDTSEPRIAMPI